MNSNPDGNAHRVAQAEHAYRQSRDELADFIMDRQPKASAAGRGC